MSSSTFLHVDRAAASEARVTHGPGLRVSRPGDAHEHEADKVADAVVRGGSVPRWAFSPVEGAAVQRDPATTPPTPMTTGDMVGKVAEAVAATEAGKKAIKVVKGDPVVKAAKDFVTTPAGIVIAGASAIGIVSTLAATKTPLPFQVPKIPLDVIHPGLAVKIDYKGPVNHPTSAMLTLSYTPGSGNKKKKQGESGRYSDEISELQAQQEQMRAMMEPQEVAAPAPGGPLAPRVAAPADVPAAPAADEKKKEEVSVQRKSNSGAPVQVSANHVSAVTQSGGRPLDQGTRSYMERRIGFDFSKVRVHDDATAANSAQALQAKAYTSGGSIVFGAGQYSPASTEGKRLLAHELAHVVQQGGRNDAPLQRKPVAGPAKDPNAALETDMRGLIAHAGWPELRKEIYPLNSAPGIKRDRQRKAGKQAELSGAGRLPSLDKFATAMHGIQHRWAEDPATTPDARVTWVRKAADDFLTGAAVPPLKDAKKEAMTPRGSFSPSEWMLRIQEDMVKQPALQEDAAADLANTTAHECRHAEQQFTAARYAAGFENLDAAAINAQQQLHKDIADIAVAQKMTSKTSAAEKKMGATMAKSMGTGSSANQATSEAATDEIAKLDPARQEALTALTALEANANAATVAEATRKRAKLRAEVDAVKKKYAAYRAIPHEADAHEVGDAEELEFKEWKP